MIRFIQRPIDAFNAASAPWKAGVIAAMCGVFGVICGFVLYVVFTHMFEQGHVVAKIVGVGVGLVVSLGIASLAHRLWEAIDTGEFKLGGHSRRTFLAVVSLVMVFELSASAFEDFARALTGDFDGIKRIAAVIAGRDVAQADAALSADELTALLARLRIDAAVPDGVTLPTPGARLISLMSAREQYRLFARERQPTDDALAKTFFGLFSELSLRVGSPDALTDRCRKATSVTLDPLRQFGFTPPQVPAGDIGACRQQLLALDDSVRTKELGDVVHRLSTRHDLYDIASFEHDVAGNALALNADLKKKLQWQREQCDAIRANPTGASWMTCADATRAKDAVPGRGVLMSAGEMRQLNRDLLAAAFPGAIEPLPILWWDLALLFLMWCTAAVVVGAYLSYLTQAGGELSTFKEFGFRLIAAFLALLVAGVIAAAMLAAVRLMPFLWLLMFDPAATEAHSFPGMLAIFNLIPSTVRWLASGEAFGFSIPGWITLPVVFLTIFVVWVRSLDNSSDSAITTFAGLALLGILVSAVAPVLEGLLGVVFLMAGAWFVPTLSLALLSPYLKPGRDVPQWWGVVALFGGLAVAFWVALGLQDGDAVYRGTIAVAGLIAASTGALILRRTPMTDLWPLLAITIGLFLVGGSAVFQQLTFAGALKELHPVAHTTSARTADRSVLNYFYALGVQQADEEIPEGFRAKAEDDDVTESLRLELALTGSIGFWLTLAMMVGWSLRRGEGGDAAAHATEATPAVKGSL